MKKVISALLFSFFLIGCAPALRSTEMMPKAELFDALGNPKTLSKNITVGSVIVDKGMGGIVAPITSDQYQQTLVSSLKQLGWYKADKARFILDAHLIKVDQPFIGFNFTVTTQAEYTLTEQKTGKVRYNDILTLPCTVMMAEEFNEDARLRRATSCAVSENITHLLKVLSQRY